PPPRSLLSSLFHAPATTPTSTLSYTTLFRSVATAFMALIGRTGLLNTWLQDAFGLAAPPIHLEQTIWLILIVHVFYNVAVIIRTDRKSTRLNSSHVKISYAVFCLKKKT